MTLTALLFSSGRCERAARAEAFLALHLCSDHAKLGHCGGLCPCPIPQDATPFLFCHTPTHPHTCAATVMHGPVHAPQAMPDMQIFVEGPGGAAARVQGVLRAARGAVRGELMAAATEAATAVLPMASLPEAASPDKSQQRRPSAPLQVSRSACIAVVLNEDDSNARLRRTVAGNDVVEVSTRRQPHHHDESSVCSRMWRQRRVDADKSRVSSFGSE